MYHTVSYIHSSVKQCDCVQTEEWDLVVTVIASCRSLDAGSDVTQQSHDTWKGLDPQPRPPVPPSDDDVGGIMDYCVSVNIQSDTSYLNGCVYSDDTVL